MILTLSTYVINYQSNLKIKFSEPSTYAHLLDWCGSLPVDCLVPWSPGARITGLFSQENNMTNGTFIQVFFFCMLFSLEGDTPETAWSHKTNFPYSAEPSMDIHSHFIGPFWTLLQLHEPYTLQCTSIEKWWQLCSDLQMQFLPILDHETQITIKLNKFYYFFPDQSEKSIFCLPCSVPFFCYFFLHFLNVHCSRGIQIMICGFF